ncbi:uncharacterized protein LOC126469610 isoform X2 [Schistocerca serialis cubense]|uniref:uncharacterized protein LOC126469610 isoform X2 n=1 Tax=Schistocerca serialis cubense TaxID=2023355 RepID=UPI00214E4411|nr:uncharacterized protein LOC126469610 isoform X2 [Schistocerca serialis cubense]
MAAPDVRAASARIVLFVAAFVLAGGVVAAPHPSHSASLSEDAPPAEASRVAATAAGDAAGGEGGVDWREYADALRGVLCPLDANFLSCVEGRVVCELKSTVRKLSNFSDAHPWLKYVEENISDKNTSDGDGCDPESQERGALTSARGTSESVVNKDDPGIPCDTAASSQDVPHNSSEGYTTGLKMVLSYRRKTDRGTTDHYVMQEAVQDVLNKGMTVHQAAKSHLIPYPTLR